MSSPLYIPLVLPIGTAVVAWALLPLEGGVRVKAGLNLKKEELTKVKVLLNVYQRSMEHKIPSYDCTLRA